MARTWLLGFRRALRLDEDFCEGALDLKIGGFGVTRVAMGYLPMHRTGDSYHEWLFAV